ncbi:MAG: hypothetical protein ACRCYT_04805 [Cetobacterium sp.]
MSTNLQNTAVRTALVAKIDLGPFLDWKLANLGLVSNLNDCFLISEEFSNNCATYFKVPSSYVEKYKETMDANGIIVVSPIAGDKMIGNNRDKGCVTKVMDQFKPVIKFEFGDSVVAQRFQTFSNELGKTVFDITPTGFSVFADVLANPSTGRDNVGALVLNSLLEWVAIAEDIEMVLSPEEVLNIDIMDLAKGYPCSHEVVLVNSNMDEVHSFGHLPIMIEDFFWQPQHGNRFSIKEKTVSMSYNQARDAVKVLCPTLGQVMLETADFNSIKEDMLLLGLNLNYKSNAVAKVSDMLTPGTQQSIVDEMM